MGVERSGVLVGDELAAWVQASCARHGVPVRVSDLGVVDRVAVLLGAGATAGADGALAPTQLRVVEPSESPDDVDPVGVEVAGPGGAGSDGDVVDYRLHDRCLAGERLVRPLSA